MIASDRFFLPIRSRSFLLSRRFFVLLPSRPSFQRIPFNGGKKERSSRKQLSDSASAGFPLLHPPAREQMRFIISSRPVWDKSWPAHPAKREPRNARAERDGSKRKEQGITTTKTGEKGRRGWESRQEEDSRGLKWK